MQGFGVDDVKAMYDLNRNSMFKIVDNVVDIVKVEDKRTIVVVEDARELIKHCVEAGVYGVSVSPDDIVEARKLVADEEAKIILGRN
jgi:phosphoenolpyruvate synthase/pyruvate phosphate dikinase